MGRLILRSASGQLQAKPKTTVFVIHVTHPKSYIETTDRRDFGGKPFGLRWGRVLSWKIPEFCSVGGARSKNSFFAFYGTIRLSCEQPTGKFYPNQWYRWKAETLKVCLLRKNRLWTVGSPGACGRLAVLNWRSSSILAS